MHNEILKWTILLLPLLISLVDVITAFRNNFFLEEWDNDLLPSAKEKKEYKIKTLVLGLVITLVSGIISLVAYPGDADKAYKAGITGALLITFLIAMDTDIKYHVVNRQSLRVLITALAVLSGILAVDTTALIILIAILVVLFILFMVMTQVGASDFRCMAIAFLSAYPFYGPAVSLLLLVLSLLVSMGYMIYFRKKNKMTKKDIKEKGAPIAPSLLIAPLIFILVHLLPMV